MVERSSGAERARVPNSNAVAKPSGLRFQQLFRGPIGLLPYRGGARSVAIRAASGAASVCMPMPSLKAAACRGWHVSGQPPHCSKFLSQIIDIRDLV